MSKDLLNYENMVERALKSVVVEALLQVAEFGLPGRIISITFATDFPGSNFRIICARSFRRR